MFPLRKKENFSLPLAPAGGPEAALDMVFVEGGPFRMGSEKDDPDHYDDEGPVHEVTVPDFFLGRYPVNQGLWRAVGLLSPEAGLEERPSFFSGDDRPVEQVS